MKLNSKAVAQIKTIKATLAQLGTASIAEIKRVIPVDIPHRTVQ
jgi:hypothetical protein